MAKRSKQKPTRNAYHITTIADAFRLIPKRCIDAFLEDLRAAMHSHKSLSESISSLAGQKCELTVDRGFTWIDDGDRRITIEMGLRIRESGEQLPDL